MASDLRVALPLKDREDMDAVWAEFQDLRDRSVFGFGIARLRSPLKERFVHFADRTINSYRSDNSTVRERDWEEARSYLSRALAINGDDRLVHARLRYCEGHLHRINGDARTRRPQEALEFYTDAVVAFEDAARLNRDWPDPHLGLARVYFYGLDDLEKGAEAIENAQKAGYKSGHRETAQLADGYRRRGERLWREATSLKDLPQEAEVLKRAAEADRQAIERYERILGFADASTQLTRTERHLNAIEERLAELSDGFFKWPW